MNKQFFQDNEANDYNLLALFNHKTKCFSDLIKAPEKAHFDASGTTLHRDFHIELKSRNAVILPNGQISGTTAPKEGEEPRSYVSEGIMIEEHKLLDLLLDHTMYGKEPLYINLMENGDIVIFNLSRLKHRPKKVYKNNIYSKGYNRIETGGRLTLNIEDAAIYNKDGELIRRPGKEIS